MKSVRIVMRWVAVAVAVPIAAYVLWVFLTLAVYLPVSDTFAERRLFRCDRAKLLEACRQVIARYDSYTNDWPGAQEGERRLAFSEGKGQWLPDAIRELDPLYVVLRTNSVEVVPRRPSRTALLGYADGAVKPSSWEGKFTCLTNGLWFLSRR